ncbi:transcriptional regulator [Bradyrhizobium sp. Tv2a-2]|uniref:transcriptional regulator n=1 Tax=Bradyrhizobium sp. Tv2a-2 TaxID=113395 RepID=UPI000A0090E5|nr:transcriptional regulator [Bradyrhizobium sp. Tv2a-2]
MADKKSAEPSPESIARAERRRVALEEGARAMADIERDAVAARKNMERLRALREAKEAGEARAGAMGATAFRTGRKKKVSR